MPTKLELQHRDTSTTFSRDDLLESESREVPEEKFPLNNSTRIGRTDILWLASIFVMLVWPWIFFGVVWVRGGVHIHNHLAKVVIDHPQKVNFIITLIATIVRLFVGFLFSKAVIRFSQHWVSENDVTIFHVSLISAFRNQKLPWGLEDHKYLLVRNRWSRVALVGVCIGAFAVVPSSITSLLTPVPFKKTVSLTGTELNLASSAIDCLAWLSLDSHVNSCDWRTFGDLKYNTCPEANALADILESMRGNILSLIPNISDRISFNMLAGTDRFQFSRPIRGVLPIGPNGVPGFNTLGPSPLSDDQRKEGILSYNYTIELQGLFSNVTCEYEKQTPVKVYPVLGDSSGISLQFNGSCSEEADVLTDVTVYISANSNNSLTFWACKSPPGGMQEPSYFIYLRGRANYATFVGNITCSISPLQSAIFPVLYQSSTGTFTPMDQPISFTQTTFTNIDRLLVDFGGMIASSQSVQNNAIQEWVTTLGVKYFDLTPYVQNPQYLRLYEAMIQGFLEYEATYYRLIYSIFNDRPSSCNRTVSGSLSYMAIGWSAKPEQIGFLIPMAIVNLASLVIMLVTMFREKSGGYESDPTDPRPLILASAIVEEDEPSGWSDGVVYRSRKAHNEKISEPAQGQETSPLLLSG